MNKIDEILELLKSIDAKLSQPVKKKRAKNEQESPVAGLWEVYRSSFVKKWTVEPERNAMLNGMMANIAKRVPLELAPALIEFYLDQNDAWYLREMHHLRCLAKDCEMLLTRMKSNRVITNSKARQMETAHQNATASKEYLERKYGRKPNV